MRLVFSAGCALVAAVGTQEAMGDFVDWDYDIPITATREWEGFDSFDEVMTEYMGSRNIPGGALAVTLNGKLVLARGYGYADVETKELVSPTALFRIASVSKPITGVAMMRLMEMYPERVSLDTKMLEVLDIEAFRHEGQEPDPRIADITVRMLLQHTAGWDRGVSFDPMFRPVTIAETLGTQPPAGPREVIRYMLGLPLDHDPGTTHAYSNFGYCILGRIIEDVSGKTYEEFVKDEVLAPAGVSRMQIGRTLPEGRAENEVRYYDSGKGRSVWKPDAEEEVPGAYGCWHLEAMDAHGGWVASAVDLVRFAAALDDPDHSPILTRESMDAMFARPEGSAGYDEDGKPKAAYYGCGWSVRPTSDGKANHWHGGSLPGTHTLLVRRHDGLNWAVLFNQRSDESGLDYGDIDGALHRGAAGVTAWPEWDLFEELE